MGFDTHPHDNMEIITIPFEGDLWHKDSMGNSSTINHGEIQVMSAGSGIQHSEFNKNTVTDLTLFQIWIFPNTKNVTPRYQQISIKDIQKENELFQILSPNANDTGVWIYQNAWMHMGNLEANQSFMYSMHSAKQGVYAIIISGDAVIGGNELHTRDAIGIWETENFEIETKSKTSILLIEVPMIF